MKHLSLPFSAFLALTSITVAADWSVRKSSDLHAPEGVKFQRIEVTSGERVATLNVVTFSTKTHTFALMDDPEGTFNLQSAAQKRGALAAVNGSYFHPDRTPLGLRIRQGKEIHPFEKAKLLSGLLTVSDKQIALLRTAEFRRTPDVREAIQSGPFLVDRGRAVAGLNATRSDARTAILVDGAGRCGLLISDALTLNELALILASPALIPSFKITRALNLDGGTSTGLWVAGTPPFYHREWRDVRDFVAIVPK